MYGCYSERRYFIQVQGRLLNHSSVGVKVSRPADKAPPVLLRIESSRKLKGCRINNNCYSQGTIAVG